MKSLFSLCISFSTCGLEKSGGASEALRGGPGAGAGAGAGRRGKMWRRGGDLGGGGPGSSLQVTDFGRDWTPEFIFILRWSRVNECAIVIWLQVRRN